MSDESTTELLQAAGAGNKAAFQRLYAQAYDELRRLARHIRQGQAAQTLDTTALVHEAYLKLVPVHSRLPSDRVHFFRIAARAMRQVLVDAARRRSTRQRGLALLGAERLEAGPDPATLSVDVLALDAALRELEDISPRQASVVECRFFAGLSVEDTAAALAVSPPTVKRDWRIARAWLARALGAEPRPASP